MIYLATAEIDGKRRNGTFMIDYHNKKKFYFVNNNELIEKSSQEIRDIIFEERVK